MYLSPLPERRTPREASAFASLIERGIECAREGSFAEAVAFFALAREQLPPHQTHLAAVLDAFIESNAMYWQAQQMLNLASRRFTEADIEQQNRLLSIEKLLPELDAKADQVVKPSPISQPLSISNCPRLQQTPLQPRYGLERHADDTSNEPPVSAPPSPHGDTLPGLSITCFGHFEVKRFDRRVALCQNRNGQAILRYLIAQPDYSASADALMGALWLEEPPEVARRKLQIAVSALRRSLNATYSSDPGGGYILYKNHFYLLNPAAVIQTDVNEFLALSRSGRSTHGSQAIELYERACLLYTDSFLLEDMYVDWSFLRREQLSQAHLFMCHAIADYYLELGRYELAARWANIILKEDRCDEKAHQLLMRTYAMQGQRSEILRQYQRCERIFAEELGAAPALETVNLLRTLLANEHKSDEEIERK